MAQFARPSSDDANTFWTPSTGADLYALLDEVTADTGDFITSTASEQARALLGLSAVTDPGIHTGHIIRVQHQIASGQQMVIRLFSDAANVAQFNIAGTGSIDTEVYTLSVAEAANITSYSTLQLQCDSSFLADASIVYWAELEVPDVGSGAGLQHLINGNLVNYSLVNHGLIT